MDASGGSDLKATEILVRAAQKGDRRALDDLFERYLPRVRSIVALRMGRRLCELLEHEDLVQEAALKVFQGLHRFEARTQGGFRNWVARCVECAIVDQVRKAGAGKRGARRVRGFADHPGGDVLKSSIFADRGPTPSQALSAKETEEGVEKALLGMPAHHREVLILRHLCGMSYAEVAEAVGLRNEGTARKACSRAFEKLKEALAG